MADYVIYEIGHCAQRRYAWHLIRLGAVSSFPAMTPQCEQMHITLMLILELYVLFIMETVQSLWRCSVVPLPWSFRQMA